METEIMHSKTGRIRRVGGLRQGRKGLSDRELCNGVGE